MAKILLRRDTATNWQSVNPVLGSGELGIETDTGKAKLGDGTTAWNDLSYFKDLTFTQVDYDSIQAALNDAHTHANKTLLDALTNSGDGTKYLADDGTYKVIDNGTATAFVSLTDTPSSYTGYGGKAVAVKTTEDGVEFVDFPSGGTPDITVSSVFDLKTLTGVSDGDIVFCENFWPDGVDKGRGGGFYRYSTSFDASLHDMGRYVKSNTLDGGWERITGDELNTLNPFWYGAIGLYNSDYTANPKHPISNYYSTIEEAQADFPAAKTLDDEADWLGFAQALWSLEMWHRTDNGDGTYSLSMQLHMKIPQRSHFYINHPLDFRTGNYTNLDFAYSFFYYIGNLVGTKDSPETIIWIRGAQRDGTGLPLIDDPTKTYTHSIGFVGGTIERFGGMSLVGADVSNEDGHRYLIGVEITSFAFLTVHQCIFRNFNFYVGVLLTKTGMMFQFTDCYFGETAGDAFYLSQWNGDFTTSLKMVRCEFQNFGRYGIFAYAGGTGIDYIFEDCDVEGTIDKAINFYHRPEWFVQGVKAAVCLIGAQNSRILRPRAESITSGAWAEYHIVQNAGIEVELVEGARYLFTTRRTSNDSKGDAYDTYLQNNYFCIVDDEKNWLPAVDGNHATTAPAAFRGQLNTTPTILTDNYGISTLFIGNDFGGEYTICPAIPDTLTVYPAPDSADYPWETKEPGYGQGYISVFSYKKLEFYNEIFAVHPSTVLTGDTQFKLEALNFRIARIDWAKRNTTTPEIRINSYLGERAAGGHFQFHQPLIYMDQANEYGDKIAYYEFSDGVLSYNIVRDNYSGLPTSVDSNRQTIEWKKGDIVRFSNSTALGYVGAVCVADGAPNPTGWYSGRFYETNPERLYKSYGVYKYINSSIGLAFYPKEDGYASDSQPDWTQAPNPGDEITETPGYAQWTASTDTAVDTKVLPTTSNGFFYECTTGGITGDTEPTWPTENGATVTDGTVVWTARRIITWINSGIHTYGKWEYFGALELSGPSADRPANPATAGYKYFDTDLGKPIYWDGSQWVDATGTAV